MAWTTNGSPLSGSSQRADNQFSQELLQSSWLLPPCFESTPVDCPDCCPSRLFLCRLEPPAYSRYDLFNPFVDCPDGTPLMRLGPEGDGGKWLCMAGNNLKEPCVAYSIGSAGEYGFEEAILRASCRHRSFFLF